MANKFWVGGSGHWDNKNDVLDTFTGTAGTNLTAHTSDTGGTWVRPSWAASGSIVLDNANRAMNTSAINTGPAYLNTGNLIDGQNGIVQADITLLTNTGTEIDLLGRASSTAATFYMARYVTNDTGLRLYKCVGGTFTQLGTTFTFTATVGTPFTMALSMNGSAIKVLLNGSSVISVTDTSITAAGSVGVRCNNGSNGADTNTTGAHFDNFKAYNLTWATSSGGAASAANVPVAGDAVIIDSNSGGGQVGGIFTIDVDVTPPSLASFSATGNQSFDFEEDTAKNILISWSGNFPISVAGNITLSGDVQFAGTAGQGGFIVTATSTYTQWTRSFVPYLGINGTGITVTMYNGTSGGAGVWYSTNNYIRYLDLLAGTLVLPQYDYSGGHGLGYANIVAVNTLALSNSTSTRVLNMNGSGSLGAYITVTTNIDASVATGLSITNVAATQIYFNNQTTLISDAMTDVSGTNLSSHTADDGSTWSQTLAGYAGNLVFDDSNRVYLTTTAVAWYLNSTMIGFDDYSVQADMTLVGSAPFGGFYGIIGRASNNADTAYLFRYNNSSGVWQLYKTVAATYTLLATNSDVGTLPSIGGTYTMKLTMVGSQITCSVNGTQIMQVNDTAISGGGYSVGSYAGFRCDTVADANGNGFHFDNFKVTRITSYTSPIIFSGGGFNWGADYLQYGNLNISGNNTFSVLQASAGCAVQLSGSNTITSWNVSPGTSWVLGAGQTQTATFGSTPSGTNQQNVSITSSTPGSQTNLQLNTNVTVSWWSLRDVKVLSPYEIIVYRGTNLGNNTNVVFVTGLQKLYAYDVYSYAGTYLGQITDSIQDPAISQDINTPGGQLTIRRGVDPTNFGEFGLVNYRNKVVMRVFTDDYPNGYTYFQGFMADWTPNMEVDNQYVDIIVLPYGSEFNNVLITTDPTKDVQNGSDTQSYPNHTQSDSNFYMAQKWVAGAGVTNLTGVFAEWQEVGNGFGDQTIYYEIVSDNAGSPDRTNVLSSGLISSGVSLSFPSAIAITAGAAYYMVMYANPGLTVNSYACVAGNSNNKLMFSSTGTNGSWSNDSHTYAMANFTTYTNTGNTQVAYNTNLQSILQDIITNYNIQGGTVTYNSNSFPNALANITVNYTFQTNTVLDGMNKCLDFCPAGWYWYVDQATNVIYFKPMATTPTHYLTLGKDILRYQLQKTMETVVNDLLIVGGKQATFNLFRRYYNLASINRYGRRQATYNDSNLTDNNTADVIGKSYINHTKNPTQRSSIDVFSYPTTKNNTGGYNIEVMRVGDVLFVQGTYNSVNLQISRIDYKGYFATIDVSDIPPQLNVQAQNIEDGLQSVQTANNPTSPTIVVVP